MLLLWHSLGPQQSGDLLQGRVREWPLPVEDAQPASLAVDSRGRVWVVLQRVGKLARLDAESGKWELFPVPAGALPRGLVLGADGQLWYTDAAGKIGRLNLETGEAAEYTAAGLDPHTPVLSADGTVWFSAPKANCVARLDPRTRAVERLRAPSPEARPEQVVIGPDSHFWFTEADAARLGRVNQRTGGITEYQIPFGDARPRRLQALGHPRPAVYYTDSARGKLVRFEVETQSFKEWPSPSGRGAQPCGIAADGDGLLWYVEISANQLVRFDPWRETFQRFTLPSASSQVCEMTSDSRGRVWLLLTGANKVAVVE